MRRSTTRLLLALGLVLAGAACGKSGSDPSEPGSASGMKAAKPSGPLPAVEVPAEGKVFKPPVQPEQVPKGAWYCDMGTVEYARMTPAADGRCPVCRMRLKQKP
jgi:hypothetical protein